MFETATFNWRNYIFQFKDTEVRLQKCVKYGGWHRRKSYGDPGASSSIPYMTPSKIIPSALLAPLLGKTQPVGQLIEHGTKAGCGCWRNSPDPVHQGNGIISVCRHPCSLPPSTDCVTTLCTPVSTESPLATTVGKGQKRNERSLIHLHFFLSLVLHCLCTSTASN